MPNAPIVVQFPVIHVTDTDTPGTAVDVSCDVRLVDLTPDQAVTEVKRFCGTVTVPGLLTVEAGVDYALNVDTHDRWAPLVGKNVLVELWTSDVDAVPRQFNSYIGFNPGLYGNYEPGEEVVVSGQSLPVMSDVTVGSGVPSP